MSQTLTWTTDARAKYRVYEAINALYRRILVTMREAQILLCNEEDIPRNRAIEEFARSEAIGALDEYMTHIINILYEEGSAHFAHADTCLYAVHPRDFEQMIATFRAPKYYEKSDYLELIDLIDATHRA